MLRKNQSKCIRSDSCVGLTGIFVCVCVTMLAHNQFIFLVASALCCYLMLGHESNQPEKETRTLDY